MDRALARLAICAPALVSVAFVIQFGVNTIAEDQWILVGLFEHSANGTLEWSHLWLPHNGHRMPLPLFVMLALGSVSDYDVTWEMLLSQGVLLISFGLMYRDLRRDESGGRVWSLVALSCLVFGLGQWRNLLWGFQLVFILAVGLTALALYLAARAATLGSRWHLVGALAAATGASMSSTPGLFVWPAGALALMLPGRSQRLGMAATWVALWLIVWAVCLSGSSNDVTADPGILLIARDTLVAAGAGLYSETRGGAAAAGALIFALLLIGCQRAWRTNRLDSSRLFIGLAAAMSLVLVAISLGRSHIHEDAMLQSRYISFSLFLIAGTLGTLLTANARACSSLLTALALLSWPLQTIDSFERGALDRNAKLRQQYAVLHADRQSTEALAWLSPNYDPELAAVQLRKLVDTLKTLRLGVFAPGDPVLGQASPGRVELQIDGVSPRSPKQVTVTARPGNLLRIRGESHDEIEAELPIGVWLLVDGVEERGSVHDGVFTVALPLELEPGETAAFPATLTVLLQDRNLASVDIDVTAQRVGPLDPDHLLSLPEIEAPPLFTIDTIDGVIVDAASPTVVAREHGRMKVRGWVVDEPAAELASFVYVLVDGRPFLAHYGFFRPDVASHFDEPRYAHAGYEAEIPMTDLSSGLHEVSLVVVGNRASYRFRESAPVQIVTR